MHSDAHAARHCRWTIAFVALIVSAALGGCTGTRTSATATGRVPGTTTPNGVASPLPRSASASISTSRRGRRWRVVVTRTPWRLPYPVSRAVATASGAAILLAGGLDARGTSRSSVVWIRPSDGRVIRSGRLPAATHDAAAWPARGGLVVAGGGTSSSVATVERVLPTGAGRVVGALPRPRSDAVAASVGPTSYVVGGYDGAVLDPVVLASTDDAATFHQAARLPVPVRYPAVAITGSLLWVIGGQTAHGLTSIVQQVDTVSGKARIVGRLPRPLDAATAQAIGGKLIIFGGAARNGTTSAILTCATPAVRCAVTGRLPYATQNAAIAAVGGHTYLLGGERDGVVLDHVVTINYVRTGST